MGNEIGNVRNIVARSRNHSCSGKTTRIFFFF